jgi:hypothetical protein
MDQERPEVVIVGRDGTEHVFLPGTDPVKAAARVRELERPPASRVQPQPEAQPLLKRMGTHALKVFGDTASTIAKASGVPGYLREGPIGAFKDQASIVGDLVRAHVETGKQALSAPTLSEKVGYGVASAIPGVGPMAARWGEMIGRGEGPEALVEGGLAALTPPGVRAISKTALPLASRGVQRGAALAGEAAGAVRRGAQEAWKHPGLAALGAYEGAQALGPVGAVLGALGAPVTVRHLLRDIVKPDAELAAAAAERAAAAAKRMAEKQQWNDVLQHAKNLDAREKYLADQAALDAKNLNARAKYLEGETAQHAKNLNARDEYLFAEDVQHAKNLNARDKYLAAQGGARPSGGAAPLTPVPSHQPVVAPNELLGLAERYRALSQKLVLTNDEILELASLKQRLGLSASEVGMSYAAAGSPPGGARRPIIQLRRR